MKPFRHMSKQMITKKDLLKAELDGKELECALVYDSVSHIPIHSSKLSWSPIKFEEALRCLELNQTPDDIFIRVKKEPVIGSVNKSDIEHDLLFNLIGSIVQYIGPRKSITDSRSMIVTITSDGSIMLNSTTLSLVTLVHYKIVKTPMTTEEINELSQYFTAYPILGKFETDDEYEDCEDGEDDDEYEDDEDQE